MWRGVKDASLHHHIEAHVLARTIRRTILLTLGAALASARQASAQPPARSVTPPPPTAATFALLDRVVAVDWRGATVRQALDQLRDSTRISFNFESQLVDTVSQRVSFHDTHFSLGRALGYVLRGTGLIALPFDSAIIVRASPPATIHGRVKDAQTGAPIADATVSLEGLWQRTLTSDSGAYHLDSVPTGTFTVVARVLGARPQVHSIAMVPGARDTVDFRLDRVPNPLERVVVTGTIVPTQVAEIPTPISVITSQEIERQHFTRVDEIFRGLVPGSIAWDQGKDDYFSTISIRGINSFNINNIKTYIDGVEVADPAYAAVDVNSIDHIEVIRGPEASTIYGSDASGGVMQIFTKHGETASDHPTLNASVGEGVVQDPAEPGAALEQRYAASLERSHGDASYDIGASYRHVGAWIPGYYSSDPDAYAGVHLDERPVSVQLSARYLERTFPAVESPALVATGIPAYSLPQNETDAEHEQTYGLSVVYRPTDWWTHNLVVGYDRSDFSTTRTSPQHTDPQDTLFALFEQATGKTSIAYNTSASGSLTHWLRAVGTLGFDHYERTLDQVGGSDLPAVIGVVSSPAIAVGRNPVNNDGTFGQIQLGLMEQLFLTAGLRADLNSGFGPRYGVALAPRFGISFVQSIGNLVVKARTSYGSGIQPGLPAQRDAATLAGAVQRANPALAPERQDGGDGGVDIDFGSRASLSLTYYNQRAHDLIIQEELPGSTQDLVILQYQNVGEIKNEGLEVSGSLSLPAVRLNAQYSYTSSKITNLGGDTSGAYRVGDQALLVPLTSGGIAADASPWHGSNVTFGTTYFGDWMATDVVKLAREPLVSPRDALVRFPGFVKFRLAIDQRISHHVGVSIGVENLTDNHAVEQNAAYVAPGRTTTIGLHLQY